MTRVNTLSRASEVSSPFVQCANKVLTLASPRIMAILNITPDSFYDGGKFLTKELALSHVETMIEQGADIIDIGAESSRPYSKSISLQEEIERLMEMLIAIKYRFDILISVDTYKPLVIREAIKQGVHIINDIYALQSPGALEELLDNNVAICLMHMQGVPQTMQDQPAYSNVVQDVGEFLHERVRRCLNAGLDRNRIIIDPGFGFGKTTDHNMTLLQNLHQFKKLGLPILVGLSRKASVGELLSLPVEERLYGSLAAHIIATIHGASIIRTHDIKPTAEALKIAEAVLVQGTLEWQ
ncbi:MAG: dihydropteroate synthase [Gammaproteobacteria bacterium]|nr:dihydropteroate synthase [Gammaproteobacteria bacterium]